MSGQRRNILLTIRFCGTYYHGFQVQKNADGVCNIFQDRLWRIIGERADIKGCSRTDTGVHANKYCLSFKTASQIPCDKLVFALNSFLPNDIAAISATEVEDLFHARYSCTGKEYVYKLLNSRIPDPFSTNLAYRFGYTLDENLLDREAAGFIGTHDFSAFCSKGSDVEDKVRTIHSFLVKRHGEYIIFTVSGNGFLYNMVRIMVGTLIFIGTGKISQGSIPDIISSKDRQKAGKTMPACGLYLNDVFYNNIS